MTLNGHRMEDNRDLDYYGTEAGSTIRIKAGLKGGMAPGSPAKESQIAPGKKTSPRKACADRLEAPTLSTEERDL
eukprot:15791735-Heterocapsa_arctica.AAC.1